MQSPTLDRRSLLKSLGVCGLTVDKGLLRFEYRAIDGSSKVSDIKELHGTCVARLPNHMKVVSVAACIWGAHLYL